MARREVPIGPTPAQLRAAADNVLPDVLAGGLRVVFCGINPGLYSAYTGHHFARPGNRFWPALHRSGFTPSLLAPHEQPALLGLGLGLTNIVARATATAAELSRAELVAGGRRLSRIAEELMPAYFAVLGVTAYRVAFDRPKAGVGEQPERLASSRLWVLPNPSGLNAHYTPASLAEVYARFRSAVDLDEGG
jgi:TDG/mug DNA glycosylase family protein